MIDYPQESYPAVTLKKNMIIHFDQSRSRQRELGRTERGLGMDKEGFIYTGGRRAGVKKDVYGFGRESFWKRHHCGTAMQAARWSYKSRSVPHRGLRCDADLEETQAFIIDSWL